MRVEFKPLQLSAKQGRHSGMQRPTCGDTVPGGVVTFLAVIGRENEGGKDPLKKPIRE